MTFTAIDEIPVDASTRVYTEGWQSWSTATWHASVADGPRPEHEWQHQMRFRPGSDLPERGLQAEGLLVVAGDAGAVCYLTDDPVVVPSIRARMAASGVLEVTADGPVRRTVHADAAAALAERGQAFGRAAGVAELRTPPRVWCSWYRYFEAVTADDVARDVAALDASELPVDVIQVDDGWSLGVGEPAVPSARFGDLPRLLENIRASGKRLGLWLAPFLVGRDSTVAREHPDWLVGPAGHNWGQDLTGLDLTHPGVREHVAATVRAALELGATYLKLDFLYGGAVPGRRYAGASPEEAYRSGLALVRHAAGPGTYLVGCGAPILPSVGLVDAMRVAPDTFHEGGTDGSAGLRGRTSVVGRAWQQGRFWVNDPDCLVARPSFPLREEWAAIVDEYGGLASVSDRVDELDDWGMATTRRHLARERPPVPFGPDVVLDPGRPIEEGRA